MKNLLIVGDSLACPRPWIGIGHEETFSSALQKGAGGDLHVINLAYSDRCSADYVTESFYKTYICAGSVSFLVIQLGIVDCAPRLLTVAERAVGFIFRKFRLTAFLFERYVKWKSKHRLFFTRWFPMTKVKLDAFGRNIEQIISRFVDQNPIEKIFIINIASPGEILIKKSWGILDNIVAYNTALKRQESLHPRLVTVIDLYSKTRINPDWVTAEDGHHITPAAHSWIASEILGSLCK